MNFREFFEAREAELIPSVPKLPKAQRPPVPAPESIENIRKKRMGQLSGVADLNIQYDTQGNPISGTVHPRQTLAIPRREMPQVKDRSDFVQWLLAQGIIVRPFIASAKDIVGTAKEPRLAFAQSTMNIEKAKKFLRKGTVFDKPIIISQDNIIYDGNHHWLALKLGYPNTPVTMWKVDMPFKELNDFVKKNEYPGLTYED
jgi:hypothetical protein